MLGQGAVMARWEGGWGGRGGGGGGVDVHLSSLLWKKRKHGAC